MVFIYNKSNLIPKLLNELKENLFVIVSDEEALEKALKNQGFKNIMRKMGLLLFSKNPMKSMHSDYFLQSIK